MQYKSTRTSNGWRNSSTGTSFGLRDLCGWGERRYACQRNIQYFSNTLNARGSEGKEFLLDFLFQSLTFLLPSSLSFSFGCGNSSWNIRTIESSSTKMKAADSMHNWFVQGATNLLNLLDSLSRALQHVR